jgi:hypothetical protein
MPASPFKELKTTLKYSSLSVVFLAMSASSRSFIDLTGFFVAK